ncbi:S-layer homology domain-containing protein [Alteribacillus sp. YIM 98480]|uniref:S-layer homology domain-containing protein n=1 Tax=Alteribacillus sp. YIM 98480 TaxID=2606599 RepID=UPI00131C139A|nr:S-layer homology domain-containing protein [Alteribacillus sp. YIM 98480]
MKKLGVYAAGLAGAAVMLCTAPEADAAHYNDVSDDFWAKGSIEYLTEEGVISGYPDGSFQPNQPITRAQAAAMMVNALDLDTDNRPDAGYEDVSNNNDRKDIISTISEEGIMRGSGEQFRPGENITRAQMAAVIRRGFNLKKSDEEMFTDVGPNYWSFTDISTIAANGIASGYEDGTFRPGNQTTRGQFSVFLENAMNPEQKGESPAPKDDAKRGLEVEEDGWTYTIQDKELVRINENKEKEFVLTREDIGEDYTCDCGDNPANDGSALTEGTQLLLHDGWIYYTFSGYVDTHSGKDSFQLFRVRTDGSGKEKVINESVQAPYIHDNQLYYFTFGTTDRPEKAEWKRADLDGSNRESLQSMTLNSKNIFFDQERDQYYVLEYDDDTMYYSTDTAVYRSSIDGSDQQQLHGESANELYLTEGRLIIGTDEGLYSMNQKTGKKNKIRDGEFLDIKAFGNSLYILSEHSLYRWDLDAEEIETLEENMSLSVHDSYEWKAEINDGNGYIIGVDVEDKTYIYVIQDEKVAERDVKDNRYHGNAYTDGDIVFLQLESFRYHRDKAGNTVIYAMNTGDGTFESFEYEQVSSNEPSLVTHLAEKDQFLAAERRHTDEYHAIVGDSSGFQWEEWSLPFENEAEILGHEYINNVIYARARVDDDRGEPSYYLIRLNEEESQFEILYGTEDMFEFIERKQSGFYIFKDKNEMTVEIINENGETTNPEKGLGDFYSYGGFTLEQRGDTIYAYTHGVVIHGSYSIGALEERY